MKKSSNADATNAGPKTAADDEQAHRAQMEELREARKRLKFGTKVLKNTGDVSARLLKNIDTGS